MACSSLLAGLVHEHLRLRRRSTRWARPSAAAGLPHGLTIGLVLAETMDRDRVHVPGQFERIADALGEPDDGSGDGVRAVRAVRRILAELEFQTLAAVGVTEAELDGLAEARRSRTTSSRSRRRPGRRRGTAAYEQGLALGDRR